MAVVEITRSGYPDLYPKTSDAYLFLDQMGKILRRLRNPGVRPSFPVPERGSTT